MAKVPEIAHTVYSLFLPQGVKIEPIFVLQAAISKIRAEFQNCHIWAWNLAISHSSRSCTYILFLKVPKVAHTVYSLSTPWGQNWAYFRCTGSGFWDTDQFSKLPYLGMKNGKNGLEIWWTATFPQNLALICFTVSEKTRFVDDRLQTTMTYARAAAIALLTQLIKTMWRKKYPIPSPLWRKVFLMIAIFGGNLSRQ